MNNHIRVIILMFTIPEKIKNIKIKQKLNYFLLNYI